MKRFIYTTILGAMALAGCQKDMPSNRDVEGAPIYLSASTESTITRVPYEQTTPSATPEGVLRTAIWASSVDTSFNDKGWNGRTDEVGNAVENGTVAIHTTANFVSGAPQLLTAAVYPKSGTMVYFVGLYPQTGWSHNGNADKEGITVANYTFNGSQDVMFADRVDGKYAEVDENNSNPNSNIEQLNFYHLLTLLKIKIAAENEEAKTAWGNVININITSKNTVSIDILNKLDTANPTTVTYLPEDTNVWLPLYSKGSDEVLASPIKPYTLPVETLQEVAYVMCSPVNAIDYVVDEGATDVKYEVPEYTLDIETEHRHIQLPIDLRKNETTFYTGSTRAKSFTLNLTFKMGNSIVATANVDDWDYGGTGNVNLGD